MAITAFSHQSQCELDLRQWLALLGRPGNSNMASAEFSEELRRLASSDLSCAACGARGAVLVSGAKDAVTQQPIAQPHFRFRAADGGNPHHPLCDLREERDAKGQEYLCDFPADRTALTKAIRDLVCRGLAAKLYTQADMRAMRLWFLKSKADNAILLAVSPDLLRWCVEMRRLPMVEYHKPVPFSPEHGLIPAFDWDQAAAREWAVRNEAVMVLAPLTLFNGSASIERALRLIEKHAGKVVLDPSRLRSHYDKAWSLARFAAAHASGPSGRLPDPIRRDPSKWGATAEHSMLAFCALLLFVSDWDLQRASGLFCRVLASPSAADPVLGNMIGLNPFHEFKAWRQIAAAWQVEAARTDARPVTEQLADLKAELRFRFAAWQRSESATRFAVNASPGP